MHINLMGSLSFAYKIGMILFMLKSKKRPPKKEPLSGLSQKGCVMGSLTHMKAEEMSERGINYRMMDSGL